MKSVPRMRLLIGLFAAGSVYAGATEDRGKQLYDQTCAVCHGADASGAMPGVPDLTERQGALTKPDPELLRSLVKGTQAPGAPLAMPPRGGNPALTDADLRATLGHLRRLTGVRSDRLQPIEETRQ